MLLRLRQKAAGVLSDKPLLLRLMMDSLSTYCVLLRHTLRIAGFEAPFEKRPLIEEGRRRFELQTAPLLTLLDLREEKVKPRNTDPQSLFEAYLKEIQTLVAAVDRLPG
jgi:hypothetical protein